MAPEYSRFMCEFYNNFLKILPCRYKFDTGTMDPGGTAKEDALGFYILSNLSYVL